MKRIAIWVALSGLVWLGVSAQPNGKPLRVGIGFSGLAYRGDFTQNDGDFLRVYPGLNVALQFDGPRRLQLQLRLGYGHVQEQSDRQQIPVLPGNGVDVPDTIPNHYFRTSLFMPDLRLRFRFIRQGPVQPYIGVGIGLVVYDPRDESGNLLADNILSRRLGENYDAMTANFPLMAGCDFRLNELLGLGLLYTFRPTQTDFLDNVGSLGRDEGRDQIHEVTMSLQFYLQSAPPQEPLPEPVQPDTLPPVVASEEVPLRHDWREFLTYYGQYLPRRSDRVETYACPSPPSSWQERVPAVLPEDMVLSQAAAFYGVSLSDLTALNQPLSDSLVAGSLLWLPPVSATDR